MRAQEARGHMALHALLQGVGSGTGQGTRADDEYICSRRGALYLQMHSMRNDEE